MPQPDNRRERGKTTQLPGLTVTPTGVRGTVGADGAAIGAAMSSLQDSAPTPIKIGQQARIVDDGSKLFTILQGAAVGGQQGIETYQKMYTYTSEKQFADFEAQLAEQHRLTGGDARKMAEWAKGSTYRPNDITAKKYNKAIAEIEGKDADVRENEQMHKDLTKISMMNNSDALDETNRLLKSADPDSRYFATLIRERNRLNGAVVGSAQRMSNRMYRSEIESTVDVLGTRLRGAGITAYDLDSERANNAARMYALMGGGDSEDGDPQRITIGKDGSIVYTDNSGTRHEGSFRGGISEELGEALKNDLGEFAGPLDDPNGIDTARFGQLETVMQYGGFGTRHTSTRGSSGTGVGTLDPTAFIQNAQQGNPADVISALFGTVPTTNKTGQVDDPKAAANSRRAFEHMLGVGVQSASNIDFGTVARNNTIDNLLQLTNPANYKVWDMFGYQSEEAFVAAVGDTRDKLVKARQKVVHEQVTGVSEELAQVFGKTRSLTELRQAAYGGAQATLSLMSTTTGNTTVNIVNEEGEVVQAINNLEDLAKMHINEFDDGFAIRVNFNDATNQAFGRGVPFHESNPFIYVGQEGQKPPIDTVNAITSYRGLVANLKTLERVQGALARDQKTGAYLSNTPIPDTDYVTAAHFLINRIDPESPEDSTLLLRQMLLDPRVSRNRTITAGISNQIMAALDDDNMGPRVQQSFMPRNGVGFTVDNIIDPSSLSEIDRSKLAQLGQLYANTSTRNIALKLVGVSDEGKDPSKRSFTTFLLTEGMFYGSLATEMGVTDKGQFLKKIHNFSQSPAIIAMVGKDYMSDISSLSGMSEEARETKMEELTQDPIFMAMKQGWINAGLGDNGGLFAALSSQIPSERNSALEFVDKNLRIAKSREVLGTTVYSGASLQVGRPQADGGSDSLNQEYGDQILATILGSDTFSYWSGDMFTMTAEQANYATVGDSFPPGYSDSIQLQGTRDTLLMLRERGLGDLAIAAQTFEAFGLDMDDISAWTIEGPRPMHPDGGYLDGPIDPGAMAEFRLSELQSIDSMTFPEGVGRHEQKALRKSLGAQSRVEPPSYKTFKRPGETNIDAKQRAVDELIHFLDGTSSGQGSWVMSYIRSKVQDATIDTDTNANSNESINSRASNFLFRYNDENSTANNDVTAALLNGVPVRRTPK